MRLPRFFQEPTTFMRLGFALMYFYSGYDLVMNPEHWQNFLLDAPAPILSVATSIGILTWLRLQGVIEIIFGLIFLAWPLSNRIVKVATAAAALEIAAILLTVGLDAITFRDLGLLGGLTGLFLLL